VLPDPEFVGEVVRPGPGLRSGGALRRLRDDAEPDRRVALAGWSSRSGTCPVSRRRTLHPTMVKSAALRPLLALTKERRGGSLLRRRRALSQASVSKNARLQPPALLPLDRLESLGSLLDHGLHLLKGGTSVDRAARFGLAPLSRSCTVGSFACSVEPCRPSFVRVEIVFFVQPT
jgi:hypothetical protein